jgi:hypothetical protein
MANVIGKYCSVAKRDEIIIPKDIPGYITPDGQTLKEDGQQLTFVYTPIKYTINYDLDGGSFAKGDETKTSYTVEDAAYVPPTPTREDHKFSGWTPNIIPKGNIGNVSFKANWSDNAILINGTELNKKIEELYGRETIMTLQSATNLIDNEKIQYYDISSTSTPIYMWFTEGTLWFYCREDIWTSMDMTSAFEGCTLLRNIDILRYWKTKSNMNISSIFKRCTLLADVSAISEWADGKFSNFRGALEGTSAVAAGRVPEWYKWDVKIHYISSTGIELDSEIRGCIPDSTVYAKLINGYSIVNSSIVINNPDLEYTFNYSPVPYTIFYDTKGGELLNPKTSYTIEDESYTPPAPIREGYIFSNWSPQQIEQGSYGNVTFIASYYKNE